MQFEFFKSHVSSALTKRTKQILAAREISCRSSTSISSITALEPSTVLVDAFPRLEDRFKKVSKKTGIGKFPLLPKGSIPIVSERVQSTIAETAVSCFSKPEKQAAVLVLICTVDNVPSVLITKRSADLSKHASEMSFPGGYMERGVDQTLEDTAIREACEELCPSENFFCRSDSSDSSVDEVFRQQIQIVGHATRVPSIHGTPVTPIIAVLWPNLTHPIEKIFPTNPEEVDRLLIIPIQELLDVEEKHNIKVKIQRLNAPRYPTPHGYIWGLTAFILQPILHRLLKPVFQLHRSRPIPTAAKL